MADKYTRNPGKAILPLRLISELDADADISAVPTTTKKVEYDSIADELKIEFNDDIIDLSAAETAMDAVISAHDGTALANKTIAPAILTVDQVLFNPDRFHEARIIRIESDSDTRKISSFPKGVNAERKEIRVVGLKDCKLVHEDALAVADERIQCPDNTDLAMKKGSTHEIEYDTTDNRWRVIF